MESACVRTAHTLHTGYSLLNYLEFNMKKEYIIDLKNTELQDGDILLTKQKGIFSWLIRYFLDSPYSHAIILYNKTAYIHALTKNGVQIGNVQRLKFNDINDINIIRLKQDIQNRSKIIKEACSYASRQAARPYSYINALKNAPLFSKKLSFSKNILLSLFNNKFIKLKSLQELENYSYCSQLVARAYSQLPHKKLFNIDYITPKDLYNNSSFEKVVVNFIDINELTPWSQEQLNSPNTLEEENKILRSCLEKVRKINDNTKNIYSLDELLDLYANLDNNLYTQKIDKKIVKILEEEGYFRVHERMKNNKYFSFRYHCYEDFSDYIKGKRASNEEVYHNISELLKMAEREIERYEKLKKSLDEKYDQKNFIFFKKYSEACNAQINMYTKLKENAIEWNIHNSNIF